MMNLYRVAIGVAFAVTGITEALKYGNSTNGNIGAVIFAIGLLAFATINKK